MSVFSAALDRVFASRLAIAATVVRDGEAAVPCRVMWRAPDRDWSGAGAGATAAARIAELRVSEVPDLAEGDQLTVRGVTHTVQKASHPDADRLLWRVELS
ncbi:head-tail joining protein [Azospirillum sp. ST 5-10]|uniref:head-tail joining protein n=1 Tax=unclassified Azospirillum TaxID=2630922 RepID=UPI003F49E8FB